MVEASQTQSVVTLKDVLDAQTDDIPTLTAIGYAVTSSQPGRSEAQKRLMAIRSARMAAMRDLAEQIHGLQVDSSTTVIDLMVQNDTFRGVVSGTIRGARTVRINPTGSDTYEVVLEIDREMIGYLAVNSPTDCLSGAIRTVVFRFAQQRSCHMGFILLIIWAVAAAIYMPQAALVAKRTAVSDDGLRLVIVTGRAAIQHQDALR